MIDRPAVCLCGAACRAFNIGRKFDKKEQKTMSTRDSKRIDVEKALAEHYSAKFGGDVWCLWDDSKRAYNIRGEGLPPAPEMVSTYPNGWSLNDYVTPGKAMTRLSASS